MKLMKTFTAPDGTTYEVCDQTAREMAGNGSSSDAPTDAKFFDVDENGVVSLKPEYRGHPTSITYNINGVTMTAGHAKSDKGLGKDGSKIDKLPEKIVIPDEINGTTAALLAPGMFWFNFRVKEIVLPYTVTEIPAYFCRDTRYLTSIKNTDHITRLGKNAFISTRLEKASFQSLRESDVMPLAQNKLLREVDIGDYIEEIPQQMLGLNARLSVVKGGSRVKKIGQQAFLNTWCLRSLPFLPQCTDIGAKAFYTSRIEFDWDSIKDTCTFGNLATPVEDNGNNDYWTGVSPTPRVNPLGSLFCQKHPDWVNETYGSTGKLYSAGCGFFTALHIHSALSGERYSHPKDFEAEIGVKNQQLLSLAPGQPETARQILEAFGYEVTTYYGTITKADYENICAAIADGAYVYLSMSGANSTDGNSGHAVMLYGINSMGEVLAADSDTGFHNANIYDDGFTYQIPMQNISGPTSDILVVKKKPTAES